MPRAFRDKYLNRLPTSKRPNQLNTRNSSGSSGAPSDGSGRSAAVMDRSAAIPGPKMADDEKSPESPPRDFAKHQAKKSKGKIGNLLRNLGKDREKNRREPRRMLNTVRISRRSSDV